MNIAFQPHPGKQTQIFTTKCRIVLVGGGKKSGKTQTAVGLPTKRNSKDPKQRSFIEDPRSRILFIRKTIPGLRYMENKARQLYRKICPTVDHNRSQHLFTFPHPEHGMKEPGAQVLFSFMESMDDLEKFEGSGWTMIIIDEARQFNDPLMITTLAAEMYADMDPETGEPWCDPQMFLLTNPGGAGGGWLREWFAIDKFPKGGKILYDEATDAHRTYIHMTVRDNPSMDAQKYIASLRQFPPWKQRQMINGDWFQREGAAFEELDEDLHGLENFNHKHWSVGMSIDYGFSTVCAVTYWAFHPDYFAAVCIDELTFSRVRPRDVARACLDLEQQRGYQVEIRFMGSDAWGYDSSEMTPAAQMAEEGLHCRKVDTKRRSDGYRTMCARLATEIELFDGSHVRAVRFVKPRCRKLWQTLSILEQKPFEDDVDKDSAKKANSNKGIDHWYDSAWMFLVNLPMPDAQAPPVQRFAGVPDYYEPSDKYTSMRAVRPEGF